MNNIQIEQFEDRLKELGKFAKRADGRYSEPEIIDWVSECVGVFYEIGVDAVIVRIFLDYFSFGIVEVEDYDDYYMVTRKPELYKVKTIGPFHEKTHQQSGFSRRRVPSGYYELVGSFYYAKIAFSSARNTLKNKVEERRIVPFWLIEQTSADDSIKHLSSSLELIENKYENKDTYGLVAESITLLDSVLNLDADLKTKDSIGGKLNSLIENEPKRQSFGVSRDLVAGLNSGRILRNEKVIHKEAPLKYEVPFLIATSFAYLILFFVECAVLNGKIIHYEN
ncbi:MAG: hypothetical protein UV05_C0013G0004 [candidate division CPR1 bacterium GW2011_GWA2_42_17]|uniref:Uncharacterized protein n=1 Tax=candidate division CPR1 bacterium GW2011_GWA2_42_17 TaxID=1618341 RepID=A0A0G0Z5S5_9BACT|nr:MAG: hypothetical protein UV05_C0013G0004 [candidate division CPR1 bacterium GW2011_GWA2_42_17]